ncbi:MAG: hypothetical protein K0R19_1424 [Bacillota bacterium]|nr:hypothetical protein [Bacillota bacterium]
MEPMQIRKQNQRILSLDALIASVRGKLEQQFAPMM